MILYLVKVIWNILYPAMKEANRVRDCFPEPPTPTSNAFPRGVLMIREIWKIFIEFPRYWLQIFVKSSTYPHIGSFIP